MKCRFLSCVLAVLALALTVTADSAQAGRFHSRRWQRPAHHPAARVSASQCTRAPGTNMVRQVDGKTLWDLGKQMGQWPSLP